MGWINNQEVLGKLRQVLNEVLELKAEESARSIELIKCLGELDKKVDAVNKRIGDLNCKVGLLNGRVDELNEHAGTLEGFIKNGVTKPMMEMLGKKVNEIGKTVDDHFESFVKVSETDSEFFKLIAQALTGKVMEEEASAEPKLTEKAKKNASEAKTTVSETDGNGGKERKTMVINGHISTDAEKGLFFFSESIEEFLEENGFKYIPFPKNGFKEFSFRKTLRKGERKKNFVEVKEGIVFDSFLVEDLEERYGKTFNCVLRYNSHYCKISFKK